MVMFVFRREEGAPQRQHYQKFKVHYDLLEPFCQYCRSVVKSYASFAKKKNHEMNYNSNTYIRNK